eukprot:CAMPEP_0202865774 /NCGR_PEP_ID=MMETSP1391-20130828/6347_1 /ASSEMBLY_ACC=CAM_ASM_000867 /TAXON_ID=1034604 /ORGANISM="Chlamydomonas leiostraca, Strain SAG 11-49" /LENGTH=157 /DNA_ID=CAMNT_0049545651 /DNA_START=88 /DNA_END=561 /DNA_ORIENTATION=+
MPFPGLKYTDEQIFTITNLVLPAWVLLLIAPGHKLTQLVCLLVTLIMCIGYAGTVFPIFQSAPEGIANVFVEMGTLKGVQKLLGNRDAALACWLHYCAADLWVGRWIAIDAGRRHIPRILMAPVLLLALFLGPVGLGFYLLFRTVFPEHHTAKAKAH